MYLLFYSYVFVIYLLFKRTYRSNLRLNLNITPVFQLVFKNSSINNVIMQNEFKFF
jgi:hypothetical protein